MEKALFETASGARFESVLTRYRRGWTSLCVSSQAGCGLGCTFCATGAVGLRRNLSADEIHAQVVHPLWRGRRPDSIAFMGMGEALANPRLLDALALLTGPAGFSPRRITVSTVGLAPRLARLTVEQPQVTVTLSVHSPFPDQRAELIPLERRHPLAESLAVLDRHVTTTRRKAYLAYLLIAGVNDSGSHAAELIRLVQSQARPELFHVSVIAYNRAIGAEPAFAPPVPATVDAFIAQLRAGGVHASRRRQAGREVDGACGQLHARYLDGQATSGSIAREG
jgi:23S rRNA (adenine-C8)-methyltransferase